MDISNKTLAMFLVASIVVSIAGTMISLNTLGDQGTPTGHATEDYGNVSVEIENLLSIQLVQDTIFFEQCSPPSSGNTTLSSVNLAVANNSACNTVTPLPVAVGANDTGGILIENNGNLNANVSINISAVGESGSGTTTFITSPLNDWSRVGYFTQTDATNDGCVTPYPNGISWFDDTAVIYPACDNLTAGANNQFRTHIAVILPAGAVSTQYESILTFWAEQA